MTQSGLSELPDCSMPRYQDIPWKHLFVEGTAIVVSILLAFGIDAWWQDRQIRREEHEVLQGLQEEFLTIHEVLARHSDLHQASLKSLEDVLSAPDTSPDLVEIVENAIRELLTPNTTDISNGTLHALLASGRLEMLSNKALRKRLVNWEREIGEVWDDQEAHAKMVYEIHVPYLINEGLSASGAMGFWYDDWSIPVRPVASDVEALRHLLNDAKFRSMVEIRYGYRKHLTQEYEAALAAVDAILTEIERSLD